MKGSMLYQFKRGKKRRRTEMVICDVNITFCTHSIFVIQRISPKKRLPPKRNFGPKPSYWTSRPLYYDSFRFQHHNFNSRRKKNEILNLLADLDSWFGRSHLYTRCDFIENVPVAKALCFYTFHKLQNAISGRYKKYICTYGCIRFFCTSQQNAISIGF